MEEFKDNREIIVAIRNGNHHAYEYLYKRYYNELFYYALSFVFSKNEACDVLHDAFIALIERRDKISEQTDIRGYLYLTVKSVCLNKLKHYNVTVKCQEAVVQEMRFSFDDSNADKELLEERMVNLIDQLPPQQQEVIKMKIKGKSYEEIAQQLNISKLTVNVHIKRAYQFIRENISIFIVLFFYDYVPYFLIRLLYE